MKSSRFDVSTPLLTVKMDGFYGRIKNLIIIV
jgi:hypothetical protein